jgi:TonB family protein
LRFRILIIPFLLIAGAYGQKSNPAPCDNPTYPVSRITNKAPVSPSTWKAPRSAVVDLDMIVDREGNVRDAVVVHSGGPDADDAVLKTVRTWGYVPAMCGATPVEMKVHVRINLRLGKP